MEQLAQYVDLNKSKIPTSLVHAINRQIKIQTNIDYLSTIFCENDDAIIAEGDQILRAEGFEMDLVDEIQKMLVIFEKPFADPMLLVDGHILSLYKSM